MQIVEYFLSIQGEGKFAGNLALFVRFAGCNFNCFGFGVKKQMQDKILVGCDTLRAVWTKEFKNSYQDLSAKELLDTISTLIQDKKPIIIITGGEPLLHHQSAEFISFIKALLESGFEVHFETNASIFIDFDKFPLYKNCIFAMGVKLSNSGLSQKERLHFEAIQAIISNAKMSFYKFVLDEKMIVSNKAYEEIEYILEKAKAEVFCMPMGHNELELKTNALKIAEFCIKNGYNYSDRIHIRLWGEKEGV
ncbi:7-carboxy-7-deazaguanine synthase QueE [Campylobacter sp. MIT 12-8780]|uniref:7-carboxy-7-deazaguanine synthase QueE n=1 Tax=unclassified Campylobacter TaxID=2593542 RepID=UPI00115C6DE7|nr:MULTISPECIES: 7-carboxy-7-deazaguanine synthase QueE [unclassified Campylobacter]NDJ27046.1 7-carboxy-7-deazaguanine synthase QueE [Campylobacter sp. MIT 19-121]TQR41653.1 7-carboxy-7-deazaguanine synthase QueE [Campylobacter sp. MIT 12-8780]